MAFSDVVLQERRLLVLGDWAAGELQSSLTAFDNCSMKGPENRHLRRDQIPLRRDCAGSARNGEAAFSVSVDSAPSGKIIVAPQPCIGINFRIARDAGAIRAATPS